MLTRISQHLSDLGLKDPRILEAVIAGGADGGVIGTEFLRRYQEDGMDGIKTYLSTFH